MERTLQTLKIAAVAGSVVAVGFGLAPQGAGLPNVSRSSARPSIVLISLDTLSFEEFSMRADLASPKLLRGIGAEFRNAVSSASWTLPSQASILTGLYPDRHGATHRDLGIRPDARLLSEYLKEAGYRTAGFTEKSLVDASYGFGRGFDIYDDSKALEAAVMKKLPRSGAPPVPGSNPFDRALRYLEVAYAEGPLFLFAQTYFVHDYFLDVPASRSDGSKVDVRDCLRGFASCSRGTWTDLHKAYERRVERLDANLTEFIGILRGRGFFDTGLLVVLSDHGEGFDVASGRIHHLGRLHRDLLHVPFFLAGRDVTPGPRDRLVSLVDVTPTVLDVVGLPVPPSLDGRSLVRQGTEQPAVALAMEHQGFWRGGRRVVVETPRPAPCLQAAIRESRWVIWSAEGVEVYAGGDAVQKVPRPELASSDDLQLLRSRNVFDPRGPSRIGDEHHRNRLRNLGYLQ